MLLLALLGSGCSSARWSRHVHGSFWRAGLERELHDPYQWGPSAVLGASLPVLAVEDERISDALRRNPVVTSGDPSSGRAVLVGMGGVAAATSLADWARGDRGESFEVLAESVLVTEAVVEVLKGTVARPRPEGSASNQSFPSSEAAIAFATASFLARRVADYADGPWGRAGLLAYLPAAYVAMGRVEAGRHFPTDVAAGALIGTWLTHWIYSAHLGGEGGPGGEARGPEWALVPAVGPDWVGLALRVRL